MSKELKNIDDLMDDEIYRSLRQLRFTFPKTVEDFKIIEHEIEGIKQPDRLKDPYLFLNGRNFNRGMETLTENEIKDYSRSLAQAAREGKVISPEVRKKMEEDKLKSGKKKDED